jgi:hypothetical protein
MDVITFPRATTFKGDASLAALCHRAKFRRCEMAAFGIAGQAIGIPSRRPIRSSRLRPDIRFVI